MHLCDAQSLGVKQRTFHRARADVAIDRAHPCMQSREMQRVTVAKMVSLVVETPRLTLKPVMNFKILIVIHLSQPVEACGDAG